MFGFYILIFDIYTMHSYVKNIKTKSGDGFYLPPVEPFLALRRFMWVN